MAVALAANNCNQTKAALHGKLGGQYHAATTNRWQHCSWSRDTFLTVDFAFLSMEASTAYWLMALATQEAVHVVSLLHCINNFLIHKSRRKNVWSKN